MDLLAFGEHILDVQLTDDYTLVQNLVDQAYGCASKGQLPPENPFETKDSTLTQKTAADKKGFYLNRDMAPNTPPATTQAGTLESEPTDYNNRSKMQAQPTYERSVPTPKSQAPAPAQPEEAATQRGHVIAENVTTELSDAMPTFSLDVSQAWPDFTSLSAMSDDAIKQVVVQLLKEAQRYAASDLHLSSGSRPFMRQYRKIHYLSDYVLTDQDALRLNTALLSDLKKHQFEQQQDFDYALALDANNRFRVNLMMHKTGAAGTYRIIPNRILTLEELGFGNVDVIKKLLTYHNGLVLVTGPVGSGKTATLAALLNELNRTRQDHVISVEAPIEIVQHSQSCQITQREVGPQTETFHSALKGALRQDPDIIVIGEMRDLETIEMAISASETGHLVIGTMHTQDASTTLNRLLDVFPAAQQTQIRAMVSESLKGVICQRLLPNLKGGISLACELLLNNTAVANMIRECKSEGLVNAIETGSHEGMLLMDKSIMKLYHENIISQEVAVANMINRVFINQVKSPAPKATSTTESTAPTTTPKKKGFFR